MMMAKTLIACMVAVTVLESAVGGDDIYDNLSVGTGFKLMHGDKKCEVIESERMPRIKNATGKMMANMRIYRMISGRNKSDVIFRVLSHREYAEENADIKYDSDDSATTNGSAPKLQNDRLLTPVDMDEIGKEMRDPANLIAFHSDNRVVHPDMEKVIKRIELDHHIRLLTHGKEDSVDSLYRIHGFGNCILP